MKRTTATKTARRRTAKKFLAAEARPSVAEIVEQATKERHTAFDLLDLLETSLVEINGVTEILLALGAHGISPATSPAIFGFLGHNMHMNYTNARGAFNHLHAYLHGPNGGPAGVIERLRRDYAKRKGVAI